MTRAGARASAVHEGALSPAGADVARAGDLRRAGTVWLITRLVLLPLVVITAWSGGVDASGRRADPGSWLMYRFSHWDSHLYAALAIRGYPQVDYPHSYFSFLPGFPWLLRIASPPGVEVRWTGLAIVTVCGLVSAVLLWQLAYEMTGRSDAARWAVICYAVAPLTVFFSVVYTEAPFIALALGAWLCGRRRRWGWAGLLAGLACTLRITGPLLVVGLAVMYVQTEGRGPMKWRLRPSALTLMSGPLFVVGYFAWLRARTGQWDAWTTAQREGFGRATAPPWVGLEDALHKLMTADSGHLRVVRLLELAAPLAAWAGTIWLIRRRWWPEAVYAALCSVSMSFSTIFDSSPRYLHAVFPLFVLLGAWLARRRPPARAVWVGASALAASGIAAGWAMQWWVG